MEMQAAMSPPWPVKIYKGYCKINSSLATLSIYWWDPLDLSCYMRQHTTWDSTQNLNYHSIILLHPIHSSLQEFCHRWTSKKAYSNTGLKERLFKCIKKNILLLLGCLVLMLLRFQRSYKIIYIMKYEIKWIQIIIK